MSRSDRPECVRPSRLRPARRHPTLLAVGAALTVLLSACGAGQVAQTARQVVPEEGGNARRGGISVANAEIGTPSTGSYASGSDAPLYVGIATDDRTSDTLTGVTTPAASGVEIVPAGGSAGASGSAAGASASPGEGVTATASASASASGTATASPGGASASPSTAASPSAAAGPAPINMRLAPATLTSFKEGGGYLLLRGLTRALTPGQTVPMTFSFAQAGDITLDVPVATPGTPEPRPSPSPSAGGE